MMFAYEGTTIIIPVRAESQELAIRKLQRFMQDWQTQLMVEISMNSPQMSPADILKDGAAIQIGDSIKSMVIPPEILELRIATLLRDMGVAVNDKNEIGRHAATIKHWTEMECKEENYAKIVHELEMIKTGQKEVPPVAPKKK